jgi:hypothetical protein
MFPTQPSVSNLLSDSPSQPIITEPGGGPDRERDHERSHRDRAQGDMTLPPIRRPDSRERDGR